MKPLEQDLSAFNKVDFEKPPIGVKFSFFRPKSLAQLDIEKNLSFCEMINEVWQTDEPFYFSKETLGIVLILMRKAVQRTGFTKFFNNLIFGRFIQGSIQDVDQFGKPVLNETFFPIILAKTFNTYHC